MNNSKPAKRLYYYHKISGNHDINCKKGCESEYRRLPGRRTRRRHCLNGTAPRYQQSWWHKPRSRSHRWKPFMLPLSSPFPQEDCNRYVTVYPGECLTLFPQRSSEYTSTKACFFKVSDAVAQTRNQGFMHQVRPAQRQERRVSSPPRFNDPGLRLTLLSLAIIWQGVVRRRRHHVVILKSSFGHFTLNLVCLDFRGLRCLLVIYV